MIALSTTKIKNLAFFQTFFSNNTLNLTPTLPLKTIELLFFIFNTLLWKLDLINTFFKCVQRWRFYCIFLVFLCNFNWLFFLFWYNYSKCSVNRKASRLKHIHANLKRKKQIEKHKRAKVQNWTQRRGSIFRGTSLHV